MPYGHRGLLAEIRHLDERTKAYDVHVQIHVHSMARACTAASSRCISSGEVTATAIVTMVRNAREFSSRRQFAA